VRSAKTLTSNEDNPPDEMFAVRAPLAADRGDGRMIVSAPETRVEPTMIGTSALPILVWSDSRSYAESITTGEVELYAAVLGADPVSGDHIPRTLTSSKAARTSAASRPARTRSSRGSTSATEIHGMLHGDVSARRDSCCAMIPACGVPPSG
jgi:hypothetical protein